MKKLIFLPLFLLIFFSCKDEAVPPQPIITDFEPKEGPVGTLVTITGRNFDPNEKNFYVVFGPRTGGAAATIVEAASTQLKVIVPQNAVTSYIWIPYFGGDTEVNATSPSQFKVLE